jgi:Flp pilus assembly pilin Flp
VTALLNRYVPARLRDRYGQSLVEYALIIVLISIAVIAAMFALSGQLNTVFSTITDSLQVP